MVEWELWRTLLAIFRQGSFAQAAKALRVDGTTVGRRLKHLEKELGYELFVRENDRLHPTERCQALLGHIESAAEALRGAERESASTDLGAVWRELRVTAPPFLVTHLLAPEIAQFTQSQRVRVELIGTASHVLLPRREADVALRIEDQPRHFKIDSQRIEAEEIGLLGYAVYCGIGKDPDSLPWAGLIEHYVRTTGTKVMMDLAGAHGFRYQAYHFETLREIAASGAARVLLPRLIADRDARLVCVSETILEQALWMLYHRQDRDVVHLRVARSWIEELARTRI